jgi:hypothetical protein
MDVKLNFDRRERLTHKKSVSPILTPLNSSLSAKKSNGT